MNRAGRIVVVAGVIRREFLFQSGVLARDVGTPEKIGAE